MSVETAYSQVSAELLERMLEAEEKVVLFDTEHAEPLIEQLVQFARRSGQTAYLWRENVGLRSLRESQVLVPGSKHLADALRFIERSMHFGIYLFDLAGIDLTPPQVNTLHKILRERDGPERRIIFLGEAPELPEALQPFCLRLGVTLPGDIHPRLRDGRWLL